MRPNDFDLRLYDAGAHTLLNSVVSPLVALADADALAALIGYARVYLAQPASLGLVTNVEAIEHFVLHAQRVRLLAVEFLEASFSGPVRAEVPASPPIAPASLWLTAVGSGVVNASSALGSYADRYELQRLVNGAWTTVAQGSPREDGVDYLVTGVPTGSQQFRVIARLGFFAGFPGAAQTVEVA